MPNLSDDQVRLFVFKAAMRDYFYSSDDVMKSFLIPTDEQLQNEIYDREAIEINKNARDRAFEKFFSRVMNSVVLKEDGTPYPEKSQYKIADDFISGKGIVFRGTDSEGFVSFKSNNSKAMQTAFVNANNRAQIQDMPYTLADRNSFISYNIKSKVDPASPDASKNFLPENMDAEMPKGGGFWNKVVKLFTGHPSQRWAKYENFQKHQLITNAKISADAALQGQKELSEENVKQYQKEAVREKHKEASAKQAKENIEKFEKSLNEINNKFKYDDETKSVTKLSTEEKLKAAQAKKAAEEAAAKEKLEAELKAKREAEKKEAERKEAEQKKAAAKKVEVTNSTRRSIARMKILNSPGMQKIQNHKDAKAQDVYWKFKRATEALITHGEPDAKKPMTEDDMVNSLTTVFLVGEMMNSAIAGYSDYGSPEANESTFGALADEVLGKSNKISNQIKAYIKDTGLAKDLLEHPDHMEKTLFTDGEKSIEHFVESIKQHSDAEKIIEKACNDNRDLHIAQEKASYGKSI